MFDKFRTVLSGKKTYLTAAGIMIAAVIEFIADGDAGKLINRIMECIALCSVRAAVSK